MPKSLADAYERSIVDTELVSLREDIATYEARARQLLAQIAEDPRNSLPWAMVMDKMIRSQKAQISRGSLTHKEAFSQIEDFMKSPVKEKLVWSELHIVTEQRRKIIATESKRLNELGWSPEVVMSMISEIADMLKPLLTEAAMGTFMSNLAASRLFNNQQFSILDQVNLVQKSLEEQLLAQELDQKLRLLNAKEVNDTTRDREGVYVPDTGPASDGNDESDGREDEVSGDGYPGMLDSITEEGRSSSKAGGDILDS